MKKLILIVTLFLHSLLTNAGIKIDTILLYQGGPKYTLNSNYVNSSLTCDLGYMNTIAAQRNYGGAMYQKYGRTSPVIGDFYTSDISKRLTYSWLFDNQILYLKTANENIYELTPLTEHRGAIFINKKLNVYAIKATINTRYSSTYKIANTHDELALFGKITMECVYNGIEVDSISSQYYVIVEKSPKSTTSLITVCNSEKKYNLNNLVDKDGGKFYISLKGSTVRKEIPNGILNASSEVTGTYQITYIKSYRNDLNESQAVNIALDIVASKPVLSLKNWNVSYCDTNTTINLTDLLAPNIQLGKFTKNNVELQTLNIHDNIGVNTILYSVQDVNNCLTTKTATIIVNSLPSKPVLTSAKSCVEASLTLYAKGAKNGNEKYEWKNWATKSIVSYDSVYKTEVLREKTTYIVQLGNVKTGCKSVVDTVSAFIYKPAYIFSGENLSICKTAQTYNLNQDVNLKGGKYTTIPNGLIKNDSLLDITKAVEGIITVTYTYVTSQNCTSTHARNFIITTQPVLTISKDTIVCQYANFDLKASLNGTEWAGENVNKSGNVNAVKTGTFTLSNSYTTGGCNVSKTMKLTVNPKPMAPTIEGDRTKCISDTLLSYAFPNSEKIAKIRWYTDTTKAIVATGLKYGLIGKALPFVFADNINESGCISSKSSKAITVINVTGSIKSTEKEIFQGDYLTLQSNLVSNQTITAYDWNFGDSSVHATLKNVKHYYIDTTYKNPLVKLKVTTTDNCMFTFGLSNSLRIIPVRPNIKTNLIGQKQQNYSGYIENNLITFYPNPVSTILYMSAYNALSFVNVQILNQNGYEILNAQYLSVNQLEFNLTGQPSGLYFLIIKDAKGAITTHKIIKQ